MKKKYILCIMLFLIKNNFNVNPNIQCNSLKRVQGPLEYLLGQGEYRFNQDIKKNIRIIRRIANNQALKAKYTYEFYRKKLIKIISTIKKNVNSYIVTIIFSENSIISEFNPANTLMTQINSSLNELSQESSKKHPLKKAITVIANIATFGALAE